MFGSFTLIWLVAFFLSMVHGNIHDIYFLIQILDRRYRISIKSKNVKAIFPASGGRAEMIVRHAFQSRGFQLI